MLSVMIDLHCPHLSILFSSSSSMKVITAVITSITVRIDFRLVLTRLISRDFICSWLLHYWYCQYTAILLLCNLDANIIPHPTRENNTIFPPDVSGGGGCIFVRQHNYWHCDWSWWPCLSHSPLHSLNYLWQLPDSLLVVAHCTPDSIPHQLVYCNCIM